MHSFRFGEYQHENLCAAVQQNVYSMYAEYLDKLNKEKPNDMSNVQTRTFDYCMFLHCTLASDIYCILALLVSGSL